MKIKFSSLLVLASLIVFSSCKKDSPAPTTPILTNTQLLTQHVWEIKKAINQVNNTQTQYIRDSINTTGANYDAQRFTYNVNGTGTIVDGNGNSNTLTWAFEPGDETTINLVINYSTPLSFRFSFVQLTQNSFTYTENYTQSSIYILAEVETIPVP